MLTAATLTGGSTLWNLIAHRRRMSLGGVIVNVLVLFLAGLIVIALFLN
jgi:hypothetical protein